MKVYVAQLGMGPQSRGLHYDEVKTFASELHVPFVKDMDSVPLSGLVQEPNRLVWEHDGVCVCGKRTYFLPRCARCFTEDKQEEVQIAAEQKQAEAEEQELKDAGPAAGGLRSGGTQALRGSLPCPYFRPGPYSQHLIILCDSHLRGIMAKPDIWAKFGSVKVEELRGNSHSLPTRDKNVYFPQREMHRIAFAVTPHYVMPVQQCVDIARETQRTFTMGSYQDAISTMFEYAHWSSFEFPAVDRSLSEASRRRIKKAGQKFWWDDEGIMLYDDECWTKLHQLVRPGLVITATRWFRTTLETSSHFCDMLFDTVPDGCTHALLAGVKDCSFPNGKEDVRLDARWEILYTGPWPPPAKQQVPSALLPLLTRHDRFGVLMCGYLPKVKHVKILSLFSYTWMVYDRFYQLVDADKSENKLPRACKPPLVSGTVAYAAPLLASAEQAGDPPHTSRDDHGNLVPDADALKWYGDGVDKREATAEEARAEAGDIDFRIGESLRMTWLTA
jgi:hypothetical protein